MIPSRGNLVRRGVLLSVGELGRVFCNAPSETSVHLFISCHFALQVWYKVVRWLGWEFVTHVGLAQQFKAFTGLGGGKRVRSGLLLVWHSFVWTI